MPRSQEGEARLPGAIDTIGQAFALLSRRPYLVWPPIALDLYLWLGAPLSVTSLTDAARRWLPGTSVSGESLGEALRSTGSSFDLFSLLAISTPSLLTDLRRSAVAGAETAAIGAALPWWSVPIIGVALGIAGVAIGMAYLTMLAYLVRGEPLTPGPFIREAAVNSWRMLALVVLATLIAVFVALPALVLGGVLLAVGIDVISILAFIFSILVLWAFLLLFFAQPAIVLSHAGPMRAIYLSYNVVRRYLWPSVGFIMISTLIRMGTPLALRVFTQSPWSVPFALVGNAFIATGLLAAALLFYQDRVKVLIAGQPRQSHERAS